MKIVFAAEKASFGPVFCKTFDNLQEMKEAVVKTHTTEQYSEALFRCLSRIYEYTFFRVELVDDEQVVFHQSRGVSGFFIEKLEEPEILSEVEELDL